MFTSKLYSIGSILIAGFVVLNTYFVNHEEFYATVIHISKSRAILLVLFNFFIVVSILLLKFLVKIFFTVLKESEIQNMESQTIHHGLNLIIVLHMLHLDFDWHIVFHISLNIAVYSFHVLGSKRIEYVIFT